MVVPVLNWLSLHGSVVALGYLLGDWHGALIALIIFEVLKFGINIWSERPPKH